MKNGGMSGRIRYLQSEFLKGDRGMRRDREMKNEEKEFNQFLSPYLLRISTSPFQKI